MAYPAIYYLALFLLFTDILYIPCVITFWSQLDQPIDFHNLIEIYMGISIAATITNAINKFIIAAHIRRHITNYNCYLIYTVITIIMSTTGLFLRYNSRAPPNVLTNDIYFNITIWYYFGEFTLMLICLSIKAYKTYHIMQSNIINHNHNHDNNYRGFNNDHNQI